MTLEESSERSALREELKLELGEQDDGADEESKVIEMRKRWIRSTLEGST
jgi:hypothetical protein